MLSPLLLAKKILLDAHQMPDQQALVRLIVTRIRSALNVDVCSLYLLNDQQKLVLSATDGLHESTVGQIQMSLHEGIVGTIARKQHLLNLPFAEKHPNYKYFPETGEQHYQGFLGVPLIYLGSVLGVLVAQVKDTRRFSEEEEAFLITMGAHLVASQATSLLKVAQRNDDAPQTQRMHGLAGATGIAIAKAWVVRSDVRLEDITDRQGDGLEFEQQRIEKAFATTLEELDSDEKTHGDTDTLSALIDVYKLLLTSPEIHHSIQTYLSDGFSAITALKKAMLEQIAVFDAIEDPYLKARSDDLRVLGGRVYRQLKNLAPEVIDTTEPVVLIGDDISVEHFTRIDATLIAGIVSNKGSKLSHASVLANALGIPAVVGIDDSDLRALHGSMIIVDGNRGLIVANPPEPLLEEYQRLMRQEQARQADLAHLKHLPAESVDGVTVSLYSNTGLLADISPGLERGSEGIGLYRSEIPFMIHNTFPTEEEQARIYRGVLEAYAPKPVIMRTLDIGGDKALPYFPINEENPFLGWRGIRFALDYRNIQLDQIRAMLLANVGNNNLKIMVPMVSREDELLRIHALVDEAVKQLKEEGHSVSKPEIGIMAEVPAVIWLLPQLRDHIDFVSIGSNDLTQYLLAVDRNNPRVAHLYSHYHPAVLAAIHSIVRECKRLNLPVSVCGEMAADPKAVLLLIGMGVRSLSMSAFKLPIVKWLIRRVDTRYCQSLVEQARDLPNEDKVIEFLEQRLTELGNEPARH